MSDLSDFTLPEGCEDVNIKISSLGVIIINTDGTMSKIPNWHELTDGERAKTVRLIAKRNQKRKEALLTQHAEQAKRAVEAAEERVYPNGTDLRERRNDVDAATAAHLGHMTGVADERRELQQKGKLLRCACCFGDYENFEEDSAAGSAFIPGYCQPCAVKNETEVKEGTDEVLMLENGPWSAPSI